MKRKVTIGVTGLNNIDSPGPGIPVIRGLKEGSHIDARIIGLSYETLEPGIYMRDWVDKVYQIPLPSSGTSSLLERLRYIHEVEKIDVIIPNFDAELHNFIKLGDTLRKDLGIETFLPSLAQFDERQKTVLYEFGEKCGVDVPKAKTVLNTNELAQAGSELGYPIVVKGPFYDAGIASSYEQAVSYFYKISSKWGLPIIVQKFVSGTEVNITVLGDGKGGCIGAVPMRKLYITDKGKAWAGIVLQDDKLMDIANRVMEKSKWKGGCELEIIKTNEGKYYLLEMNPRFPAWVYLAVGAGQNHPEALVRMALGETVEPFKTYDKGKLFIRYAFDQIVNLSDFEKISTMGEL